jgi:negative regulator of genetic competence, sporulation and motility
MIKAAVRLFEDQQKRMRKSALYYANGRYLLKIDPAEGSFEAGVSLLSEYGRMLPAGPLTAGWLDEHAECILSECAADTIFFYFGR